MPDAVLCMWINHLNPDHGLPGQSSPLYHMDGDMVVHHIRYKHWEVLRPLVARTPVSHVNSREAFPHSPVPSCPWWLLTSQLDRTKSVSVTWRPQELFHSSSDFIGSGMTKGTTSQSLSLEKQHHGDRLKLLGLLSFNAILIVVAGYKSAFRSWHLQQLFGTTTRCSKEEGTHKATNSCGSCLGLTFRSSRVRSPMHVTWCVINSIWTCMCVVCWWFTDSQPTYKEHENYRRLSSVWFFNSFLILWSYRVWFSSWEYAVVIFAVLWKLI